ncbi:MAG: hypothetical protein CL420_00755 [Acidimicrobiaceae bacterium]|nr:hypothetical protein [Acidimicrobiaceae bacterium]
MIRFTKRSIIRELRASGEETPVPENKELVHRMASLAKANHLMADKPASRVKRVVAAFGSLGLAGWVLSGVAGASVLFGTLTVTDSLPDPIQRVTSEILETVGINVPNPDDDVPAVIEEDVDEPNVDVEPEVEAPEVTVVPEDVEAIEDVEEDKGKPESPGKSEDADKPEDVGRPENPGNGNGNDNPGRPDDVGRPENPGNGNGNGNDNPGRPENPGNDNGNGNDNPGRPENPGNGIGKDDSGKPENPGNGNGNSGKGK